MCPESSEKYAWFVDAVYPEAIKPYGDAIIETSAKEFVFPRRSARIPGKFKLAGAEKRCGVEETPFTTN